MGKKGKGDVRKAGRLYAAAALVERGYSINFTKEMPAHIEATNKKTGRKFRIRVHATTEPGWWKIGKDYAPINAPDIFYIFVDLDLNNGPKYHIAPSSYVATRIDAEHQFWAKEPGKRVKVHDESNNMRLFSDLDNLFLNRWDLIK